MSYRAGAAPSTGPRAGHPIPGAVTHPGGFKRFETELADQCPLEDQPAVTDQVRVIEGEAEPVGLRRPCPQDLPSGMVA